MTEQFVEKTVTVLDLVADIQSVVERYKKKGWLPTSYVQLPRNAHDPRSVKITFSRVKSQPTTP